MFYLRVTGEVYSVTNIEYCEDSVLATNLETGLKYLIPKDELTSNVVTEEGEQPLFKEIDFTKLLNSFSSQSLIDELLRRGDLPEGVEVNSNCVIEECYKICRRLSPNNYSHLMKPNTFTEDYNKALSSLSFYRSTEPSPENIFIVHTRSTVLED